MSTESPRPLVLLGPIIGDMAGKPFEGRYNKTIPDPLFGPASRFSDDTILTCAVADGLVRGVKEAGGRDGLAASAERQATVVNALARSIKDFGREYRHRGYGGRFRQWLESDSLEPYNSYGNGAVMRAGFAGWYATSTAEAELFGRLTARPTHNHPEAEEAAAALAACIHILKSGGDKKDALRHAQTRYDLSFTLDALRPIHAFNITAKATLIAALACFLESRDFAECVGLAISLGGDCDTLAAVAGSLAEAHYAIPPDLMQEAVFRLDARLLGVLEAATRALEAEGLWRPDDNREAVSLSLRCVCSWPEPAPEPAPSAEGNAARPPLLGAIIGDMAGAPLEGGYDKRVPAPLIGPAGRFTDETVMTCAVAEGFLAALAKGARDIASDPEAAAAARRELLRAVKDFARAYRRALPGDKFHGGFDNYDRFTSGAAARVSFAGLLAASRAEAEALGRLSAEVSYGHDESAVRAAATASACIHILATGGSKRDVLDYARRFLDLNLTLDALRPLHAFNIRAAGVLPAALLCFLESETFADCIGLALSLGGDCDTTAAIAGGLAEAHYEIDPDLARIALAKLDARLRDVPERASSALAAAGRGRPATRRTSPSLRCVCSWT